ncbi:ORF6N domain-containing protein [Patescibacteria group bacterium]|nr:ORF6N domain-containing protein [Patescibacteria group bacterium]MCG2700594.1 ORF6N domain-containing protein [Candidatus Parcubacteria bacterium]
MPKAIKNSNNIAPQEIIESKILLIRGQKVMLDRDLAVLYGVETKVLNQAVRRNIKRFPEDFMFRLAKEEFEILRSQFVTSSWGGQRYAPYAFTEQGVAMLSSVLNSKKAVEVNIVIMRTFVNIRKFVSSYEGLAMKIAEIEKKYDKKIGKIFTVLDYLIKGSEEEKNNKKQEIGFKCG